MTSLIGISACIKVDNVVVLRTYEPAEIQVGRGRLKLAAREPKAQCA